MATAPGAVAPHGPALTVNRTGAFDRPRARDGAGLPDGPGALDRALDGALDRSGALDGPAGGLGDPMFEGSGMFEGSSPFDEPARQYATGGWASTQVLSLNESWEDDGHRPRRPRWWLPAIAAATAVVAGTAVAVAAVVTSKPHHAAKPDKPAAARSHQASPSMPPAPPQPSAPAAVSWALTVGTPSQGQPPPPPVLAPPGTTVQLAETLLNSTQQPVMSATFGLTAPQGWTLTPESPPTVGSVPAGGKASVTWRVSVPAGTQPGGFSLTATATCAAATTCPVTPVTGNAVVPSATSSQAFNNAGIAPQADSGAANLDGAGNSYQAEALAAAGFLPGGQVVHDGISFAWPDAAPGAPDNVAAQGQTFLLSATGTHLAFLGAGVFGSSGGDGTIFYQNGTQQTFHLVMDDWWANQATPGQDEIAVTTARPNGPPDQPPLTGPPVAVYFASIPLQQGSTVAAVMLPAGSAPANNVPSLHLFAVAVG